MTALPALIETTEREQIQAALSEHNGNRSRAARALGIPRTTLLAKMKTLDIPHAATLSGARVIQAQPVVIAQKRTGKTLEMTLQIRIDL